MICRERKALFFDMVRTGSLEGLETLEGLDDELEGLDDKLEET
jgi:hypothetical protein